MNDPVDQLEYGLLSPVVKYLANDIIAGTTDWAIRSHLLPGALGYIIIESALLLAWTHSLQTRLGLEPSAGDAAKIIAYAMKVLRESKPGEYALAVPFVPPARKNVRE